MLRLISSRWIALVTALSLFTAVAVMPLLHHRADTPQDQALAQYVIAGGLISDLCLDPDGSQASVEHCAFCLLITSVELANQQGGLLSSVPVQSRIFAVLDQRLLQPSPHDPSREARAPPHV